MVLKRLALTRGFRGVSGVCLASLLWVPGSWQGGVPEEAAHPGRQGMLKRHTFRGTNSALPPTRPRPAMVCPARS